MSMFIAAWHNTLDKIFARGKYRVVFILAIILTLFFSLFSGSGLRFRLGIIDFSFSNGAYLSLAGLSGVLLPLCSFMLCSDLIAHELSDSSIKSEILRPIGRAKLYLSKLTAIVTYNAIVLFVCFVIAAIIGMINGSVSNVLTLFIAQIMSLLVCAVFVAFSGLIASLTGNPSMTMFLSILLYIGLALVGSLSNQIGAVLFTGQIAWYKMIIGSQIPWKNLGTILLMLFAYLGLFSAFGQMLFERKNIS